MAVEIRILSGARQGEQIFLDAGEFRAGDERDCEVFFDPGRDPAAKHRGALFRLKDDGWYVKQTGSGELLLNQEPVVKETHLRSGDLVRMSDRGPDFSFTIISRIPATPTTTPAPAPDLPPSQPDSPAAATPDEPPQQPPEAVPAAPARAGQRQLWVAALMGVAGLAICALLLVWVLSVVSNRPAQDSKPIDPQTVAENTEPNVTDNGQPTTGDQSTVTNTKPQKDAASSPGQYELLGQLRDTVYLIQVEMQTGDRSFSWPFATCCAIAEDTLLTSAREAYQMAKWHQQGHKIWATRPQQGVKVEVKDFRVRAPFPELAEKPGDWLFANLGLLMVEGKLPKTAPLASFEGSNELEEGLPLKCLGFSHQGEKITRFDTFEPRVTDGKVYVITPPPKLPGCSDLLELKAKIPANSYGSPIFNRQGQVVGVYADAAADAGVQDLQYATVVNPEFINEWLQKRNPELWVPPVPAGDPSNRENAR